MDPEEFQSLVDREVASLPAEIHAYLKDVAIVVERLSRRGPNHLGLYEGVPLTSWGRDYNGKLPDKITLYQIGIELAAGTPEQVPHQIRETLLREIAHFLGHDHPAIHRMEKNWRKKRENK